MKLPELQSIVPAAATEKDHVVWQRLLDVTGAGSLDEMEAHKTVLRHAVDSLAPILFQHPAPDFARLAVDAPASKERWENASGVARRIDRDDELSVTIVFLLAQHTTSGAANSAWARALHAVAASLVGLEWPSDRAAGEIVRQHGAALRRFLAAQRTLTVELLNGIDDVVLHRAVRLEPVPQEGEFDPRHQPLAGHSLNPDEAPSLAMYGQDALSHSGEVVLLSGRVPTSRLLSTPATGFGGFVEQELVLLHGVAGDRVTVTHVP